MREGYDLIIGRRYLGDAKSEDDDIVTAFGNWLLTNRQYPAWRQLHRRDSAPFEIEKLEQLALIARLPTDHGKPPPLKASARRNHCSPKIMSHF
jgi:hypothetical protein